MQNIEWKPIKDYEDLYMISNTGLVKITDFDVNWLNIKEMIINDNRR